MLIFCYPNTELRLIRKCLNQRVPLRRQVVITSQYNNIFDAIQQQRDYPLVVSVVEQRGEQSQVRERHDLKAELGEWILLIYCFK